LEGEVLTVVGTSSSAGGGVDFGAGVGVSTSAEVPIQAPDIRVSNRLAKSHILKPTSILRQTNLLMNILHPLPQGPEKDSRRRRGHVAVSYT
jgi:hypothetical protein